MDDLTAQALKDFTARYCDAWHEEHKSWPLSEELYGVPSPCIISTTEDAVYWQPQPFTGEQNVNAVERAFDIVIQPTIHTFYTTQFAGDMHAQFGDIKLTLLQTRGRRLPSGAGKSDWSSGDSEKAKTAAHAIYRDAGRRVRGHLGV